MKNHRLIEEAFSNFVSFICLFGAFSFFYIIFTEGLIPWFHFVTIIPFFGFWALRKKVTNFYAFAAIHLVYIIFFITLLFVLPLDGQLVANAIFAISFAIYSMLIQIKRSELDPNPTTAAFFVVFLVTAAFLLNMHGADSLALNAFLALLGLLCVFGTAMFIKLQSMYFGMRLLKSKGSEKEHPKQFYTKNFRTTYIFFGIITAFAALVLFAPPNALVRLATLAFQGFIWLLIQLARLVSLPFTLINCNPGLIPPDHMREYYEGIFEHEEGGGGWAFNYSETPSTAVVIAIIALTLTILVFLVYRAMKKRRDKITEKHTSSTSQSENIDFNLKDLLSSSRKNHSKHPIRKAYRKKVNQHIKKGTSIAAHYTTQKIANAIPEDISELTKAYKPARYGKE